LSEPVTQHQTGDRRRYRLPVGVNRLTQSGLVGKRLQGDALGARAVSDPHRDGAPGLGLQYTG
jgi:hypothetical protein